MSEYDDILNLTHEVVTSFPGFRRARKISPWVRWSHTYFNDWAGLPPLNDAIAVLESVGWKLTYRRRPVKYEKRSDNYIMSSPSAILYVRGRSTFAPDSGGRVVSRVSLRKRRKDDYL